MAEDDQNPDLTTDPYPFRTDEDDLADQFACELVRLSSDDLAHQMAMDAEFCGTEEGPDAEELDAMDAEDRERTVEAHARAMAKVSDPVIWSQIP